jgi:hypothetical protein
MSGKEKSTKKPCSKCPYKLGQIHTVMNPCPNCEMNNYSTYEVYVNQRNCKIRRI